MFLETVSMRTASLFSHRFAAAAMAFTALTGIVVGPDGATPPTARDRMPVREVTIFKDGHAFVLHRGEMATDRDG